MTDVRMHLEVKASADVRRLVEGVRRFSTALRHGLEIRDRVVDVLTGAPGPLHVAIEGDGGVAVWATNLQARVELGSGYLELSAALGALGAEIETVIARHAESLREALSAVREGDGTGQGRSGEASP